MIHLCSECAKEEILPETKPGGRDFTGSDEEAARVISVAVDTVVITEVSDQQYVVFREMDGCRRVGMLVGIFEATTIDHTLKGSQSPRPLTHDAWLESLAAFGANAARGVRVRST